jgi:acetyl esterase/lipase
MGNTLTFIAEHDVPYGTGGGHDLLLDVLRPNVPLEPARPLVIWVHGGGWQGGERDPSPNGPLASRGFVTASISYRFSQEAIFPAQIHDVKAAISFLRANAARWGIDPDRIGIWGGSAGGHLSALAAVTGDRPELEGVGGNPGHSSRVQAAVPLSPPTDFLVDWGSTSEYPRHPEVDAVIPSLLGGEPGSSSEVDARARLASPIHQIAGRIPPILVMHGTQDDLVPISQARTFVEALLDHGAEASLLELPHDDHGLASVFGETFDLPDAPPTPAMREIIEFFERTLGPVDGNAGAL